MKTLLLLAQLTNTEHQIRLCDDNKSIIEKLHLSADQKKDFRTYYFETSSLDLGSNGLSVRARLKANHAEITVKKKFGNMNSLKLTSSDQIICENDLHGGVKEYSCKISSNIDKEDFQKVLKGKKNWLKILTEEQLSFLKKYHGDFKEINVYGTLSDNRYQWTDKIFGVVTLDLVEQVNREQVKYNEISIRYNDSDNLMGPRFEEYFKKTNINACLNQRDWDIDKFATLEILN